MSRGTHGGRARACAGLRGLWGSRHQGRRRTYAVCAHTCVDTRTCARARPLARHWGIKTFFVAGDAGCLVFEERHSYILDDRTSDKQR
eukprot:gene18221-biopygen9932